MGKQVMDLLSEVTPLIKYLAGTSDYKKLRFTVSDIEGFLTEKLLNVWMKYSETLPYAEVKAITIASLYNYRGKIYKKYSQEVSLGEEDVLFEDTPYEDLLEQAVTYLRNDQALVLEIIVDPPLYIRDKVGKGSRIPSNLVLDYLDMPVNKKTVKKMNNFRRNIFNVLQSVST